MNLIEILKSAVQSIVGNVFRSFLTMLGVVIGIFSVVILTAAVQGVKQQATDLISGLGPTTLIVIPGASLEDGAPSFSQGLAGSTLTKGDVAVLRTMKHAKEFNAVAFVNALTTSGDKKAIPFIIGGTEGVESLFQLEIDQGRTVSLSELKDGAAVALLGSQPIKKLGLTEPLGKSIQLGKELFTIIGTYKETEQFLLGFNLDDIVTVPLTTASRLRKNDAIDRIYVVANNGDEVAAAKQEIKDLLVPAHNGEEDFSILEQKDTLNLLGSITDLLTALLGGIAGISLLVGGIGIMNIMLVSVTERTREIGIRKAIGATNEAILIQFLVEAVLLTVIGAALGLALAVAVSALLAAKTPINPVISPASVLLAAGVSVGVGVVFGLFPAVRAARKPPVEALRYE